MKNQPYITAGILGLIIIALIAFFVWPLLLEIKNNSDNLSSLRSTTAGLEIQNSTIEDFKKTYDGYQPNLAIMDQMFVDPQNPVDFIAFLENTATDSGINAQVAIMPTSQLKSQNYATFQVACSDDFLKVMGFLGKLESGSYLVEVSNLTMKSTTDQSNPKNPPSGKVDTNFVVRTFVQQQ
jgi:hypothetical protein